MKIVFILFNVILVVIAFVMKKAVKSDKDLLVPTDGLPFVLVAFAMAASQFGSSMLIGGVQQAQQQAIGQGFWPAVYTLLAASASCFINIFIAPRFRTFGSSVTPPDFVETRFGKSSFLRGYHSVVYIFSVTAILVSQIIGFAGMGYAFGFTYEFSAIFCAVVICLLAMGSGMVGVAVTNMVQYLLIMLLLGVSVFFSLRTLGTIDIGFSDVFNESFFPTKNHINTFFYSAWPMFIGNLFSYEYFMRFMSCKGIKEAKKASCTAGFILLATVIPVALLGAVANYFYQDASSAEVFGLLLKNELPPVMGALLMMVVLMAIVTSADSMLTSVAGMVSRDIYAGIILKHKPLEEISNLGKVTKVSMLVVAVIAAICSLFFTGILKVTFFFSPFTSGVMFAPMIVGLFWKGASRKGAIAAVVVAAIFALLHITNILPLFDRVAGPALIGTVTIVVVSLVCPDKKTC